MAQNISSSATKPFQGSVIYSFIDDDHGVKAVHECSKSLTRVALQVPLLIDV